MGAGAADLKISPRAMLKGDFEYQHKTERDGSGYQLLGGTTLPDINRIYPLHHAWRSALGAARYLRRLQHQRAFRLHILQPMVSLRRGQPKPFADSRQRDLRLWLVNRP